MGHEEQQILLPIPTKRLVYTIHAQRGLSNVKHMTSLEFEYPLVDEE